VAITQCFLKKKQIINDFKLFCIHIRININVNISLEFIIDDWKPLVHILISLSIIVQILVHSLLVMISVLRCMQNIISSYIVNFITINFDFVCQ
jgi:hypothetical protein